MLTWTKQTAAGIFDLFFPPICSICGVRLGLNDETICADCRSSFELVGNLVCPVCSHPIDRPVKKRCPNCPTPPAHFQSARSAYLYRGQMAEAVKAFKYSHCHELGLVLARAMFVALLRRMEDEPLELDLLLPVPMHYMRRLKRGYNHAGVLALEYGKLAGVHCSERLLHRIRYTPRQALLPAEERLSNVQGAFEVSGSNAIRGLRVGLIDDVLTSGCTVNECARTLIESGAAEVHILTLARA